MNNLTCSICGKNFNNIDDYLKCVTACTKKYKEKEAAEKKAQAEAEAKAKREKEEKEVKALITEICEKKQQYYSAVNKLKAKYPNAFIAFQFEPALSLFSTPSKKDTKTTILHDDFFDAVNKLLR